MFSGDGREPTGLRDDDFPAAHRRRRIDVAVVAASDAGIVVRPSVLMEVLRLLNELSAPRLSHQDQHPVVFEVVEDLRERVFVVFG